MREKQVEQKLVAEVRKRGGICPKFVSPGFDGMPDRIVLLPGRHFGFVEVKAPVSYTHLDVYKRQSIRRSSLLDFSICISSGNKDPFLKKRMIP